MNMPVVSSSPTAKTADNGPRQLVGGGGGHFHEKQAVVGRHHVHAVLFQLSPLPTIRTLRSPSGTHTPLIWFEDYLQG